MEFFRERLTAPGPGILLFYVDGTTETFEASPGGIIELKIDSSIRRIKLEEPVLAPSDYAPLPRRRSSTIPSAL